VSRLRWVSGTVGVAVLVITVLSGATAPSAAAAAQPPAAARRLLVVSLPMVTWAELPLARMPNLHGLLEQSIVADLSVRGVDRHPSLGDAYVTIAAGTRAKGNDLDGEAAVRADGSIIAPAFPDIVTHNNHLLFDAHPGVLATALAKAGISRAVIGNADAHVPVAPASERRQIATAFATPAGVTPGGEIGARLLQPDPSGPYGLAIDPAVYLSAFRRAWTGRTVVMVEDSDLVRFDALRDSGARPGTPTLDRLLERFDHLLGEMLGSVDRTRDAVMVVGPTDPRGHSQLTVASLRAPGIRPGLAVSDFTRRSGFVSIVDIGPTILNEFRVAAPDTMEGRPMDFGRLGGSFAERRSFLVDSNVGAVFRDERIGPVTIAFITAQVFLTVAAAIAFTWLGRRSRRVIEIGALSLLGVIPATFLAVLLPFDRHAVWLYWLFIAGVGAVIGIGSYVITDRRGVGALVVCLGAIVALLLGDIVTGAHLQFNTVFGYSPTVAGRFAGIGNLAYSELSAAALLLACLLAYRVGGRRGAIIATALLAVAIVVDGMPIWGSDIGGVLSMVPAYGIAVTGLLGLRVRVRTLLIALATTALALVAFTLIDLSRPKEHETHLGRLVRSTQSGGWHSLSIVIRRKLAENFGVLFSSPWTVMVPIALAGVAYIIYRAPGRLRALHERIPPMRWGLVSLAVLAVLGFSLNDSGISIPGVMMGVLTPVMIVILVRADRDRIAA
jgi:hypothetical protein